MAIFHKNKTVAPAHVVARPEVPAANNTTDAVFASDLRPAHISVDKAYATLYDADDLIYKPEAPVIKDRRFDKHDVKAAFLAVFHFLTKWLFFHFKHPFIAYIGDIFAFYFFAPIFIGRDRMFAGLLWLTRDLPQSPAVVFVAAVVVVSFVAPYIFSTGDALDFRTDEEKMIDIRAANIVKHAVRSK